MLWGGVTRWRIDSSGRITAIKPPHSSSDVTTIAYDASDRVSSITAAGLKTGYSYTDLSGVRTTTLTGPGGATTATATESSRATGLVTARVDASGGAPNTITTPTPVL